jgi:monoamine oxidase
LGYVSAALPGRADARLDLARPLGDRLFFAGEATSLQFMGDVHGAWLSGIDAANTAARALE